VAAVLGFRRDRRYLLDLILPLALTAVAVAFFLSSGQSAIVGGETAVDSQRYSTWQLVLLNVQGLPQLWAGAFGSWGLGWLDTTLPGIVWVTSLTVFAAVVFWGLRSGDARKWLALAGAAAAVVAVPLYILVHDGIVVGEAVQPRYVYPLIVIFGGVAVAGLVRADLGLRRLQLLVVVIGLTVANSVALHVNLRRYVTGLDVVGLNLDRDVEWWWNAPVSPMGVWIVGSLAFAAAAGLLAWRALDQSRSAPDGAEAVVSGRNTNRS
jgi:hypothetical protein